MLVERSLAGGAEAAPGVSDGGGAKSGVESGAAGVGAPLVQATNNVTPRRIVEATIFIELRKYLRLAEPGEMLFSPKAAKVAPGYSTNFR